MGDIHLIVMYFLTGGGSNVLKENQAQCIIEAYENGLFYSGNDNPLYLGFCIIVVADTSNPAHLSYIIQHLRMI